MTDVTALKAKIDDSGFKLRYLAKKLNLSYQAFFNKVNGVSDFKTSEAGELITLLGMTPEETVRIFFGMNVGKEPTKEER